MSLGYFGYKDNSVPNLQDADKSELIDFVARYFQGKLTAVRYREIGLIPQAKSQEAKCEYWLKQLPEEARW